LTRRALPADPPRGCRVFIAAVAAVASSCVLLVVVCDREGDAKAACPSATVTITRRHEWSVDVDVAAVGIADMSWVMHCRDTMSSEASNGVLS
jgi:hypothetical protein